LVLRESPQLLSEIKPKAMCALVPHREPHAPKLLFVKGTSFENEPKSV
jgi:hypothetical protein